MQIKRDNMGYEEEKICKGIELIINKEVDLYTQKDIDSEKSRILKIITDSNSYTYFVDEVKSKFDSNINCEFTELVSHSEYLKDISDYIKNRYIYEEALMQLVNENKLIPTEYRIRINYPTRNADIELNVRYKYGSNKLIYIKLDSLVFTKFRVSKSV